MNRQTLLETLPSLAVGKNPLLSVIGVQRSLFVVTELMIGGTQCRRKNAYLAQRKRVKISMMTTFISRRYQYNNGFYLLLSHDKINYKQEFTEIIVGDKTELEQKVLGAKHRSV